MESCSIEWGSKTRFVGLANGWRVEAWWRTSTSSVVPRWRWCTTRVVRPVISTLFQPHGVVVEEARAVADELGLPPWWLNEQASVYIAPGGDVAASRVFDHPGLRVSAASPEHLLAMKVLAGRRRDAEDIHVLVEHLGLTSAAQVLALCAEVFPEEEVPPRARLILAGLFDGDES
jgi:hypothetical protein